MYTHFYKYYADFYFVNLFNIPSRNVGKMKIRHIRQTHEFNQYVRHRYAVSVVTLTELSEENILDLLR